MQKIWHFRQFTMTWSYLFSRRAFPLYEKYIVRNIDDYVSIHMATWLLSTFQINDILIRWYSPCYNEFKEKFFSLSHLFMEAICLQARRFIDLIFVGRFFSLTAKITLFLFWKRLKFNVKTINKHWVAEKISIEYSFRFYFVQISNS